MPPRATNHRRYGSSRQVRKTTYQKSTQAKLHPEAQGLGRPVTKVLGLKAQLEEQARAEKRVQILLAGVSHETVALLRHGTTDEDYEMYDCAGASGAEKDGVAEEDEWVDEEMPGVDDFMSAMRDVSLRRWRGRRYKQQRRWKYRRTREEAVWGPMVEPLADAYLQHKYGGRPAQTPGASGHPNDSRPSPQETGVATHDDPGASPAMVSASQTEQGSSLPVQSSAADSGPDSAVQDGGPNPSRELIPYSAQVFCLFTRQRSVTIMRPPESTSPALDLMANGFVAKTPAQPRYAVSVESLELLYRIRRRKASFSIEAFAKLMCDYYMIPYRPYLRNIFADTFEIYIRVLRAVDHRVHAILGWNSPDWRPLNACRACCYKVKDEPHLRFSRIFCLDGNNSLKRVATSTLGRRTAGDTRILQDVSYYLPRDFVDRFAHEVRGRQPKNPPVRSRKQTRGRAPIDDDSDVERQTDSDADAESTEGDPTDTVSQPQATRDDAMLTDDDASMDPTAPSTSDATADGSAPSADGSARPTPTVPDPVQAALDKKLFEQCVKNWKAAAGEEKKQMWRMFDESGLFASACRHGFILWIVDMIRSGELAKYPLAIMRKILDTFDPDFAGAYDIGCVFETTVNQSSLGEDFRAKNGRMFVPAFHGYSHSHICQLQFHPNIIEDIGLEDAECLERVYSGSNALAPIIRYASAYRRMLLIEEYFKQWDAEKHLNTGIFMLNNYVQALEIIEQETAALQQAHAAQGVTEELLKQWLQEERAFFATLGDELDYDVRAMAYVELLQQLRALEPKMTRTAMAFHAFVPSSRDSYNADVRRTHKLEAERRHAIDQHDRITFELAQLEVAMGITKRWTPLDQEYKDALKYMQDREYRRTLDKLQKLVIQRLFELDKLNIAETGYKMRTHLAKSLQVRCKTIRRALDKYNAVAAAMSPPRPALDWEKVSHYSFLEEFTLLQDTRNDIRERPWAQPLIRQSIKSYRRLNRAKEELNRLNCEVVRVHTAIRDEVILFRNALDSLDLDNPIRGALADFVAVRTKANGHILLRIEQIYALPGYTGKKGPGEAVRDMNLDSGFASTTAQSPTTMDSEPERDDAQPPEAGPGDDSESDGEGLADDELEEEMGALIQYIAGLALVS